VAEHIIRTWTVAATAEVLGRSVLSNEPDTAAQLANIERRLTLLDQAHEAGFVPDEAYRRQQADIEAERAGIESAGRTSLAFRVGIDWTLPDAELNASLLDLIYSIELGSDYRPVGFVLTREPVFDVEEGSPRIAAIEAALAGAERVPGGWRIAWSAT
jgi:hypothetical protein